MSNNKLIVIYVWLASFAVTGPLGAAEGKPASIRFQTHCALCHGDKGRPEPSSPTVQSLGTMPADLTDALFSSREPAADWFMVIKYGGAALGLSEVMPPFKDSLSDKEIEALVDYIKMLSGEHDYPSGDMNFTLPIRTKKAFPEDEVVWKLRYQDSGDKTIVKNVLELEKRVGKRSQLSLELVHEFDDGDEKFSELEPGFKSVLYHDKRNKHLLSVGGIMAIPLKADKSVKMVPYIATAHTLSDSLTLQSTLRADLPIDELDEGTMEFSGVVHWASSPWPRSIVPALEVISSFPFSRGGGVSRKDLAQVSLLPQFQFGLSKGGHVAVNLGGEIPLNDTDRYDYRIYMYLLWDFADGSIFSGW